MKLNKSQALCMLNMLDATFLSVTAFGFCIYVLTDGIVLFKYLRILHIMKKNTQFDAIYVYYISPNVFSSLQINHDYNSLY